DYDAVSRLLDQPPTRDRARLEAGHLFGGTASIRAAGASELAFSLNTALPAPGWVSSAARSARVYVTGEGLHQTWTRLPNSRAVPSMRRDNVCVRDRNEAWVEVPGSGRTAHLQLPE